MRQICNATKADVPFIMEVLEASKGIMRASGNMHQWTGGYPSEEVIYADIAHDAAFVVKDDDTIVAYFAFIQSPEPTYSSIYEGAWLEDTSPYHVIHRMGSYPQAKGIFKSILDWAFTRDSNIRIDTHHDNRIMQHCIEKYGFSYCGIIYLADGAPRLAYQMLMGVY